MPRTFIALLSMLAFGCGGVFAAKPIKQLPPAGTEIKTAVREALSRRAKRLQARIDRISGSQAGDWRPDIEVFVRAVQLALEQNLFFKPADADIAAELLDEAQQRLLRVQSGERGLQLMGLKDAPTDQQQLLVGGFRSRIDDSIQPFGLVVPAGYPQGGSTYRVDVWLHGRGDTKTEIPFLHERMTKVGQYAPEDTLVLHPFGRHCNAFKFAGETDVYEAIDHLRQLVPVDTDRLAIRGFSMGGAGCWHLAVHDPGRWFAANPGAGFVDTIVYQGWGRGASDDAANPAPEAPFEIDDTRQQLLRWYDVLPWVTNLSNTKTIAYSGEVDKQRMAADRVAAAARRAGIELEYVIGKGMGHKIDPRSAAEIDAVLSQWDQQPRPSPRRQIEFVTYTLRYHQVDWLSVTGLEQHWLPGRVNAQIADDDTIEIRTSGITRIRLDFSESGWPHKPSRTMVSIDGQELPLDDWAEAPGIQCDFERQDAWSVVESIDPVLRKRPGLQGPIDDAFCDRFVFVMPSRPATHGVVERWIDREASYAKKRWRRLMRGDVRVVKDVDVTEDHIANCHLICFGDFRSNQYLRSVAPYLPIRWTRDALLVGDRTFDPSTHAAVFCYPNPRNPRRYLVANSGMTFRDFSNVSNSRQIAMLPDWAVLDVSVEEDALFPGNIAAEGFFDEQWALRH